MERDRCGGVLSLSLSLCLVLDKRRRWSGDGTRLTRGKIAGARGRGEKFESGRWKCARVQRTWLTAREHGDLELVLPPAARLEVPTTMNPHTHTHTGFPRVFFFLPLRLCPLLRAFPSGMAFTLLSVSHTADRDRPPPLMHVVCVWPLNVLPSSRLAFKPSATKVIEFKRKKGLNRLTGLLLLLLRLFSSLHIDFR